MVSHDNWDVMIPFFSPWKIDFFNTCSNYVGIQWNIMPYHLPRSLLHHAAVVFRHQLQNGWNLRRKTNVLQKVR